MRMKVLLLTGLLIMIVFYCGCAVDMSSEEQTPGETEKVRGEALVIKRLGAYGGEDNPKALIRNDSGDLYIVEINSGTAKKVEGFRPR